jgi:alanine-synthesizing transaminase
LQSAICNLQFAVCSYTSLPDSIASHVWRLCSGLFFLRQWSGTFSMFSDIVTSLTGETNPLYRLRDQAQGQHATDLVAGNVNEHGILFPQELLEEALCRACRECAIYRPDSLGQIRARTAISAYYAKQGQPLREEQILLTPGTSISYWYCFKLLADVGEEILCPQPGYPLFDYIAALSGVRMIPYRLRESTNWRIDFEHLEASISTRTRALVLISPHNPTGHVSSEDEISVLAEIAARHDLAIISDEVFNEFLLRSEMLPRPAASAAPLVITLNGFSKMLALPGIKLGWMAVTGRSELAARAMKTLGLISDTFLPVNEVVQTAVPTLLEAGAEFQQFHRREIRARWQVFADALRSCEACDYIQPDGGFYVTLRLKGLEEEAAAESILRDTLLLVHPGYFYSVEPSHLILSFVQRPDCIRDYVPRLRASLRSCNARIG